MEEEGNEHEDEDEDNDEDEDDEDDDDEKEDEEDEDEDGSNNSPTIKRCYNDDDESDKSLANIAHFDFFPPCYRSCYLNACRRAIKR